MAKRCELYDRECIGCGECDICDLDPSKTCTNCGKCIDDIEEYRSLNLEAFMEQQEINRKFKVASKYKPPYKKKES